MIDLSNISGRITEYLTAGGLFNPEAMEHEKARALLIDCRAYVDALVAAAGKVTCLLCGGAGSEFVTDYVSAQTGKRHMKQVPCPACSDLRKLMGESHE